MNTQKLRNTSIIAVIAIATIALVVGLSQTQATTAQVAPAPPQGNNVYVFGEGVSPQATFTFKEATVTYDFQLYTMTNSLFGAQVSGFASKQVAPEFTLSRIVGNTPYLHEAVDQTYEYSGRNNLLEFPYKLFDVDVKFMQAGQSLRTFHYGDCQVSNYKIDTRTDNEEGYVTGGKTGFAVVETYTFICNGYKPISVDYDSLKSTNDNPYKPYGQ